MVQQRGLPTSQPAVCLGYEWVEGREVQLDVGQGKTQVCLREAGLLALQDAQKPLQALRRDMHRNQSTFAEVDF
jgi:hypothetical protein